MATIDTLLLLALPASGKSEIRRYLDSLDPEEAARDCHLGPTVQLDDYPYVQLMSILDQQLMNAGDRPVFFDGGRGRMLEPRDWGSLARLLAEDYAALGAGEIEHERPTAHLLDRFDRARRDVGAPSVTSSIPSPTLERISRALDHRVGAFLTELGRTLASYTPASTVVVEFARGGPEGAGFPLPPPHGYRYTLPLLGFDMLERSRILYVWVTPEESRRRNRERAGPGPEEKASVLHHRVPDIVMRRDYGTDDLLWLADQGGGRITIEGSDGAVAVPVGVFDNRADYTSFLRGDRDTWPDARIQAIHGRLKDVFDELEATP